MTDLQIRLDNLLLREAPSIAKVLRPPASSAELDAAERELGARLPDDVREAYLWHNGQETHYQVHEGQDTQWKRHPDFFAGFAWNSLEEVLRCWRLNNDCLDDLLNGYGPQQDRLVSADQRVRSDWWNPAYIPIARSNSGDCLCIDLEPGPAGSVGQVIEWFDENSGDEHPLIAVSLRSHLQELADRLESEMLKFSGEMNCWVGSHQAERP